MSTKRIPIEQAAADLTIEQAAVMLVEAVEVHRRLLAEDVDDYGNADPLPRGFLTCGEALRTTASVVLLAMAAFPTLCDASVLERALRDATLRYGSGALAH